MIHSDLPLYIKRNFDNPIQERHGYLVSLCLLGRGVSIEALGRIHGNFCFNFTKVLKNLFIYLSFFSLVFWEELVYLFLCWIFFINYTIHFLICNVM